MFDTSVLRKIMPLATQANVDKFGPHVEEALEMFEVNTPARQAAFLAQLAHESGQFRYVRELADGKAYEGRKDLGNTQPGDGPKFKGRGLIQITGRNNYKLLGDYLGVDLISNPAVLEQPDYAVKSAGWFWHVYKNLNPLADAGDFRLITKKINGGYNGYDDRLKFWERAKKELGA